MKMKRRAVRLTVFATIAMSVFLFVPGCSDDDDDHRDCVMSDFVGDWCRTDPCDQTTSPDSPAMLSLDASGDMTYTVDVGCDNVTTGTWTFDEPTSLFTADYTGLTLCDPQLCYQDVGSFSATVTCPNTDTRVFQVNGESVTFTRCGP
jgi:hypothetical protein